MSELLNTNIAKETAVRSFPAGDEIFEPTESILPVIAFCPGDICKGYIMVNFRNPAVSAMSRVHSPCGQRLLVLRPENSVNPK